MKNRLKLDFSLNTNEERVAFLEKYLNQASFIQNPPTPEELEMMGNYICWGKDKDGKNMVQRKEVEIKTKHQTWSKKEPESLEALMESPTFNESIFDVQRPQQKTIKENFSRDEALKNAPANLLPIFKELFKEIDRTDLLLNYYDLRHGKRKNPPREELLNLFTKEEQENLQEQSTHLNQYIYLKKRHELVELRKQQFTLKDSYVTTIQRTTPTPVNLIEDEVVFDFNVQVFPLGVISNSPTLKKLFNLDLSPKLFTEEELKQVSDYFWEKKEEKTNKFYFNFTIPEHIAAVLQLYFDLEDQSQKNSFDSTTLQLIKTLKFYIDFAELSDLHKDILKMKIQKKTNQEIADLVNAKYEKSYRGNYISTIFRQKIIPQISDAAKYHLDVVGNLWFPEEFKTCTSCGRTLLLTTRNFGHKSRSKDGFNNKCKTCSKKKK